MRIERHFSNPKTDVFNTVAYEQRDCVIRNADGSTVFEMHNIEAPRDWSQLASDILISKYIRKAGVASDPSGHETSVKQVIGRIVGAIRRSGEAQGGYFDTPADAEAFEAELAWLLLHQHGAFNSPVWFNCGLFEAYGIEGSSGNWHWNDETKRIEPLDNNYRHPQCSACFIQSVDDDLMSIFGLVRSEARLFKYGSGTGTNFSAVRGNCEHLSGGGTSSGLMSFLEVFDRAAGATKSGGTTRRAAKMVCLDADHPEVRDFVQWKSKEEKKVRALIEAGYSADFNGEAYHTISGQNSNNSLRLSDAFMERYMGGGDWETRLRTSGEVHERFPARDLMREVCQAAWECADPGVQFDTTINAWHTCPNSAPIRASNPCSEYMFLDDSACNLASINLLKYLRADGSIDVEGFLHSVRIFIVAQEILVDYASYPVEKIAQNSHDFRPLGLGYANLGALLMECGLPYDSDAGRRLAGALTALMTARAYRVSAEMAQARGAFAGYAPNAEPMLAVIAKHRAAVDAIGAEGDLIAQARAEWDAAFAAGRASGFRNAQVSVLAPTGTIGLLMDCATTGVEPDYALVKFKKLSGGGFFKIVNHSAAAALERLGYSADQIAEILEYVLGSQSLESVPHVHAQALAERGLMPEEIALIESALAGAFEIGHAFARLSRETLERLGIDAEQRVSDGFSVLTALGFSKDEIAEANRVVCGAQTIEGAPHLAPEHYAVFDCANKSGALGRRYIEPMGHIRMMAAVQPFLSGAISKTINLPHSATPADIETLYRISWEMGLKAVALYRDGCKSSQPLSSGSKKAKTAKEEKTEDWPNDGQLEMFPELGVHRQRRYLPKRRGGLTVEARVAGHKVFVRTGEYEDGELGEIFIDMHKEGSSFRSLMMCFAIAVSKGLQYGVPLSEFVDTFTFTNFEPRGVCDHPNIKMTTSVIDYVFRLLGLEYLDRTDFCQVKPDRSDEKGRLGAKALQNAPGKHPIPEPAPLPDPNESRPDLESLKSIALPRNGERRKPANGSTAPTVETTPLDRQLAEMMGDAPLCDICGHITVRNGACYKCLNCGHSMGCS